MSRRRSTSTAMGPPPDRDIVMGPPPVPPTSSQTTNQPKNKGDQEIVEKYRKLKRRYFELEEKHKDTSTELQRSGERNVKMREERNILLDRIIELERQPIVKANGTISETPPHQLAPHPPTGAFPRSLLSAGARNSFVSNLRQAMAEDDVDDGADPLLTSRHVGPTARKRAEEEKKEKMEEEAREARRAARRGRGTQQSSSGKGKEMGGSGTAHQPLLTFAPATGPHNHTGPGVQGSVHNAAPAPILVSSTGTRLRIKPPAPPPEPAPSTSIYDATPSSSSSRPSNSHTSSYSSSHSHPSPLPLSGHQQSPQAQAHPQQQPEQEMEHYERSSSPTSPMPSPRDNSSQHSAGGSGSTYSPKNHYLRSNGNDSENGNGIRSSHLSGNVNASGPATDSPSSHGNTRRNSNESIPDGGNGSLNTETSSANGHADYDEKTNANGSDTVTMDVSMHSPSLSARAESVKPTLNTNPNMNLNYITTPSPKPSLPSPALQSNPYSHLATGSMPPIMNYQMPNLNTPMPGSSSGRPHPHAKPKRLKAHTVTTKSYSIPMVPRDKKGKPMLPLNVGIMTVICLGDVCMREHFHTERYIFPVGYEVTRRYLSTVDPHAEVVYHCTILDGGDGPKFQIVPSDVPDRPVIAGTATGAWSNIVKQANHIRNRQHSNSVSGPDFFGLGQNTIKHLIQELPAADRLRDYVWQNFVEGGHLGGRHAAVIPALPDEYDTTTPIGAYYPSERDRERDRERERERREAVAAATSEDNLRSSVGHPAQHQASERSGQQQHAQIQLQPGLTQIVLPPPTTSETLNIQEYQPPAPKESERRTTRASANAGNGLSLPTTSSMATRSQRKTSRSPRESPSHTHHTRSSSNSSRSQLASAAAGSQSGPSHHSPYLANSTAARAPASPPPVPATFASIMNAYPAPASNASPQSGSGRTSSIGTNE